MININDTIFKSLNIWKNRKIGTGPIFYRKEPYRFPITNFGNDKEQQFMLWCSSRIKVRKPDESGNYR